MAEYERGFEDGKKAVLDKLTPIIDALRRDLLELKRKSDEDTENIRHFRETCKNHSGV